MTASSVPKASLKRELIIKDTAPAPSSDHGIQQEILISESCGQIKEHLSCVVNGPSKRGDQGSTFKDNNNLRKLQITYGVLCFIYVQVGEMSDT